MRLAELERLAAVDRRFPPCRAQELEAIHIGKGRVGAAREDRLTCRRWRGACGDRSTLLDLTASGDRSARPVRTVRRQRALRRGANMTAIALSTVKI